MDGDRRTLSLHGETSQDFPGYGLEERTLIEELLLTPAQGGCARMPPDQMQRSEAGCDIPAAFSVAQTGRGKSPDADGAFSKAPNLNFYDDKVKFEAKDLSNANKYYGSASGFVPKFSSSMQKVSFGIPFVASTIWLWQATASIRPSCGRSRR